VAKVIGVIVARMSSKRLPGKVAKTIVGKSMFAHHVERMRNIQGIDGVFLATSKDPLNRELIQEAKRLSCGWYAGAEQDVVGRCIRLCEQEKTDAIIYVPCDSPLFDIESASLSVKEFKKKNWDYIYVSNMTPIQGTVKELVSYSALRNIHKYYRGPAVTIYIIENRKKFKTLGIEVDSDLSRPEYRLTVDHLADLKLIRKIYEALYKGQPLSLHDVYVWLDDNPKIAKINKHVNIGGFNEYVKNLKDKPLYSIVSHGGKHSIFDSQEKNVDPKKFMKKFLDLFPRANKEKSHKESK